MEVEPIDNHPQDPHQENEINQNVPEQDAPINYTWRVTPNSLPKML